MVSETSRLKNVERSMIEKFVDLNWTLILLVCAVASVGFAVLYSAANGDYSPWASRQMVRFGIGLVVMVVVAMIDLRWWMRWAYVIYAAALVGLVAVEFAGSQGMGAQRWINLGVINLQPSEMAKLALVLALARYFHGLTLEDVYRPLMLLPPLAMIAMPALLVLRQPDLGTAALLVAGGGTMLFLAGVKWWMFAIVLAGAGAAVPIAWEFLHDYQRNRILTFLNPESDPLGTGYHILQSKIALGSGGITGKGFLQGTQSHLNFLPEKQTDFVFTMLAEELGLAGGLGLLLLYGLILAYGIAISLRSASHFGRLLAMGVTTTVFFYVFINVAMVMGLIPVVGVPLPLVSYGGTAMLTILVATGFMMCVYVHRDLIIGRRLQDDEL